MTSLTDSLLREARSVSDLLARRARLHPDRVAFRFLEDGERETGALTFGELDARARAVARHVIGAASPGDRALFMYPPCLDFVVAFFGCLYARVIPVPVYPPRQDRSFERLLAVIRDASAGLVLTTQEVADQAAKVFERLPGHAPLRWLVVSAMTDAPAGDADLPPVSPEDIAFLQYTSGSTGDPKGVVVLHGNLLVNLQMIHEVVGCHERDVTVSWLPQFHDMGLIGMTIYPIAYGGTSVQMPPSAFLQRPVRWLQALSAYGGALSTAPNFAYELCCNKVKESEFASLRLEHWQRALNGAEPIRHDTLARFAGRCSTAGLAREFLVPCYGMAEATLIVSAKPPGARFVSLPLHKGRLEQHDVVIVASEHPEATLAVGSGRRLGEEEILIVDPETRAACPPLRVGEIWLRGGHVAGGYWNRPDATRETFAAECPQVPGKAWLRTGDLGFVHDGELFITGRHKDLVIVGGRNLYPQDIEYSVERASPAIRKGGVAAFSIEGEDGETLAVVAEVEKASLSGDHQATVDAILQEISTTHEVGVGTIVLIPPGTVPKTSSGKIQRRAARRDLLQGAFTPVHQWAPPAEGPAGEVEEAGEGEAGRMHDLLKAWFREQGEVEAAHIDIDRPMAAYGVDSVVAAEFTVFVESLVGEPVPPDFVWTHQTIREMARFILGRMARPA